MNKENLQKSISLIGPMSVGKTLLSSELSKRLNMPRISIDELRTIIGYEMDNCISLDEKSQQAFIDNCFEEVEADENLKHTLKDPIYSKKLKEIFNEMVNTYKYYRELLGDLSPLYPSLKKFNNSCKQISKDPIEFICLSNKFTSDVLNFILSKVNTPVILDFPGPFGWQVEDFYFNDNTSVNKLKKCDYSIDFYDTEEFVREFLKMSTTVFLHPGQDYEQRNDSRYIRENKVLSRASLNYSENAHIEISTNGMFYNPEDLYFKQKKWFDPIERTTKESLLNHGEISNICNQIISHIEELSM